MQDLYQKLEELLPELLCYTCINHLVVVNRKHLVYLYLSVVVVDTKAECVRR